MKTDTTAPRSTRLLVGALLAVSLGFNISALLVPFMNLRIAIGNQPYSLVNSVHMLWTTGLYVLAVLVVGFSLIFPFAKLGILAWLCLAPRFTARHHHWLGWVERLGKWSMLDALLVCLILCLTAGQVFVGARPMIGIPLFVTAILISMISGEILTAATRESPPAAPAETPPHSGLWIALIGLCLVGTLTLPFLQISDWKLADRTFSIALLVPTLWIQGTVLSAALVAAFLIVAPLAAWFCALRWWWSVRRGHPGAGLLRAMHLFRRWSMLDVFGLALTIFLVEGDYLMRTEIRWGALFLVVLLALQHVLQAGLDRAIERAALRPSR